MGEARPFHAAADATMTALADIGRRVPSPRWPGGGGLQAARAGHVVPSGACPGTAGLDGAPQGSRSSTWIRPT